MHAAETPTTSASMRLCTARSAAQGRGCVRARLNGRGLAQQRAGGQKVVHAQQGTRSHPQQLRGRVSTRCRCRRGDARLRHSDVVQPGDPLKARDTSALRARHLQVGPALPRASVKRNTPTSGSSAAAARRVGRRGATARKRLVGGGWRRAGRAEQAWPCSSMVRGMCGGSSAANVWWDLWLSLSSVVVVRMYGGQHARPPPAVLPVADAIKERGRSRVRSVRFKARAVGTCGHVGKSNLCRCAAQCSERCTLLSLWPRRPACDAARAQHTDDARCVRGAGKAARGGTAMLRCSCRLCYTLRCCAASELAHLAM